MMGKKFHIELHSFKIVIPVFFLVFLSVQSAIAQTQPANEEQWICQNKKTHEQAITIVYKSKSACEGLTKETVNSPCGGSGMLVNECVKIRPAPGSDGATSGSTSTGSNGGTGGTAGGTASSCKKFAEYQCGTPKCGDLSTVTKRNFQVVDPACVGGAISCKANQELCGLEQAFFPEESFGISGLSGIWKPFKPETLPERLFGYEPGSTPAQFVLFLFQVGLALGGILAFFQIVVAGVQYAMAGANPGWQNEAKAKILDAILGLLLLFAAVLILRTIDPNLIELRNPGTPTAPAPGAVGPATFATTTAPGPDVAAGEPVIGLASPGWDRGWTFASANIEYQKIHASPQLQSLLTCMGSYFDANGVARSSMTITSISDSNILAGTCEPGTSNISGCQHTLKDVPSCHYGGVNGFGAGSFAFDTLPDNRKFKTEAAHACGAKVADEGNHLHVTIGHRYASCDLFFGE